MLIFAIETSCDETSAAVVKDGIEVKSCLIASSKGMFEKTTGVIPEEAARHQLECMTPIIDGALIEAKISIQDIDAIAVTKGPGLLGSLLVGTAAARVLASVFGKPIIGVHHTLGHLSSTWLDCTETPLFPVLTLSASGGHTDLWLRTSHTHGFLLGATRDDAAGEAFDKGASLLGLPYPGGPSISKAAENGDAKKFPFPLPLREDDALDFSFSGLKTSLKYTIRDHQAFSLPDLAASYEQAICAHLIDRLKRARKLHPEIKEVHIVGGVSANNALRRMLTDLSVPSRVPLTLRYCTDNAAMIASAGYFLIQEHGESAYETFETEASLPRSAVLAE